MQVKYFGFGVYIMSSPATRRLEYGEKIPAEV